MNRSRRRFIQTGAVGVVFLAASPGSLLANSGCNIQHPMIPPDGKLQGSCDNCGMMRPMWGRTWHTFKFGEDSRQTCSIHCVAEMAVNSGMQPAEVMVANYLDPHASMAAANVYYVIGSSARGTMSTESKIALPTEGAAREFVQKCGGEVVRFDEALDVATAALAANNTMIQQKRIAKGKIVEPTDADLCPVCGMHVARYPENKCQIRTRDGEVIHLCATQCLFEYLQNAEKYRDTPLQSRLIWVVDYATGMWIPAQNASYVVGSTMRGPMGKEAFPFAAHEAAGLFARKYSGEVVGFREVSVEKILL